MSKRVYHDVEFIVQVLQAFQLAETGIWHEITYRVPMVGVFLWEELYLMDLLVGERSELLKIPCHGFESKIESALLVLDAAEEAIPEWHRAYPGAEHIGDMLEADKARARNAVAVHQPEPEEGAL